MIIEYRVSESAKMLSKPPSYAKRTYKDVTNIETTRGGVTHLTGTIPAELDDKGTFVKWAQTYFIAAICLAPGEYLERVDLPRD
jgi:hypothetical protein